jgi:CsoR family transcriptional regulator, copper-sensing transcriptional repressor
MGGGKEFALKERTSRGDMTSTDKTQLLNRARSIQGHMGAVVRMLEEDAYCIDIIKQSQAIEKALEKLNGLILEKHLNNCVTTAIRSDEPSERERVIGELMDVFQTASKM